METGFKRRHFYFLWKTGHIGDRLERRKENSEPSQRDKKKWDVNSRILLSLLRRRSNFSAKWKFRGDSREIEEEMLFAEFSANKSRSPKQKIGIDDVGSSHWLTEICWGATGHTTICQKNIF